MHSRWEEIGRIHSLVSFQRHDDFAFAVSEFVLQEDDFELSTHKVPVLLLYLSEMTSLILSRAQQRRFRQIPLSVRR